MRSALLIITNYRLIVLQCLYLYEIVDLFVFMVCTPLSVLKQWKFLSCILCVCVCVCVMAHMYVRMYIRAYK